MKKTIFFFVFFIHTVISFSQQKKTKRFSLTSAAGVNIHAYTKNYIGWYTKLGVEYKIWKGLYGGIRLWHTNVDEFPARFKSIPFSADDETNFINQFIGTPEKDWYPPKYKGFYHILQGDIATVSIGYEFRIRKKLFMTPHYSFGFMRSKYIVAGIYEASFSNGVLVNGKVYYDFRIGNLTAGSIGFDIGYKLNDKWKLFLDIEDLRDINGTGAINYEAKSFGTGIKYSLK